MIDTDYEAIIYEKDVVFNFMRRYLCLITNEKNCRVIFYRRPSGYVLFMKELY